MTSAPWAVLTGMSSCWVARFVASCRSRACGLGGSGWDDRREAGDCLLFPPASSSMLAPPLDSHSRKKNAMASVIKDNQGIIRRPSMFIWAKVPITVFVQEFPTPTWVEGGEGWSPHAGRCPQIYCRRRTSAEAVLWLGHRAEETLEQLPASFLLAFPQ